MTNHIHVDLHNVQETLLLPLWGRAVEIRKRKPLLVDATAADIVERIDYDFRTIAGNINPITQLAWIARSLHIDRTIREFLQKHPGGTIVNIGCGLDTTFERVDNGKLIWYDLDLPDVIALRRHFVTEGGRRRFIVMSFLEHSWPSALEINDSILFIAAGVFYYFEEVQIRQFLSRLAGFFPGGEAVFDVASPLGLRMSNKVVLQAGGMDENSFLKWGIENARDIQSWDHRIAVIDEFPMFKGVKRHLDLKAMFGTFMSDRLRIMSMVHLSFLK
jgi:O-methyltransferase involved in polyketide biosynthesis